MDRLDPHTVHYRIDVRWRALLKLSLVVLLWIFVAKVWPVLIMVMFSLMLVATFNPLVRRLELRTASRFRSVAAVLVSVGVLVVAMLALVVPVILSQGYHLIVEAPHYARQIHDALAHYHIHADVEGQVDRFSARILGDLPMVLNWISVFFAAVAPVITVCVLTIYLLIEGREVANRLARLLPRSRRLGARRVVNRLGDQVGGYMRGQLITSALAGCVTLLLLMAVGVPDPAALAVLTAAADAVPIIGLLIALAPCALVALALSPAKALLVIVVTLVYHQIEANFICPKVYGNTMGLSLSTILISLMLGYQLLGIVGMVVALPIAAGLPGVVALLMEWHDEEQPTTIPLPGEHPLPSPSRGSPGEHPLPSPSVESNPFGPTDGGRKAEEG